GGERTGAAAFSIGNRGYVGGGFSSNTSSKNDFYEYNPTNNSWVAIDKPGNLPVYEGNGFSIGNKGYIYSGSKNQFWEYGLYTSTTLIWVGNINSNWNTPSNWSPAQLPTKYDNVIISPSNFPPTVQSNLILNGLTVLSGAFIKVNPSITLSVSGSIFNQGNICRNGGTIIGIVSGSPILNAITPSVSIAVSPSTTINALSNAVFTATVVNLNGGSASYTFFVNGLARQTSSVSSFSINSLTNLNTITSSVTINQNTCVTQNSVNSNGIIIQVNKLSQSINFPPFSNIAFGSPNITLPGFSSAGLPITYSSSNTSLASIGNNNEVRILGAGTLTVTAFQNGNDYYSTSPQVQQVLVVQKADQTIDFGPISPKNPQSPSFRLVSTASSGLIVSYVSSNLSVATISGNTVFIRGNGTTTITGSQAGNANYNQAPTVSQVLVVSPLLGIEDDREFELKIYPNPANGRIYVEGMESRSKITLFNILGKELRSKESSGNTSFDLTGIEPGEYLIRITSDEKSKVRKFIIE
ncbi:MAG: T9SS type A sorting domain-containing protein, partial [Cytophagales bacterium]|nr:T9SS type A sorting domain-containing protein [Cytophagales bacterium]